MAMAGQIPVEIDRFGAPRRCAGVRFWHGPARFEAALLGRAGLLFVRPPRSRWRAWGGNLRSEATFNDSFMGDRALRSAFHRLRHLGDGVGCERRCRQSADAGNRGGRARRRAGLSQAPVHDDRHRRHRDLRAAGLFPRHAGRGRLPDRRGAVGRRRLHRHERLGARQCAHRAGRDDVAGRRA